MIGDNQVSQWQASELRIPTAGGIGALFVSIECAMGTFLCGKCKVLCMHGLCLVI